MAFLCAAVLSSAWGRAIPILSEKAFQLKNLGAAFIPINFFIPVPGHYIKHYEPLTAERCLRILSLFRMIHPRTEIRIAAGREYYLKDRQAEGLRIANSLFVFGYLNEKGDDDFETIRMIKNAGYEIDT